MFSVGFWMNILINTLAVLIVLYLLKKVATKYNITPLKALTEDE